MLVRRVTWLAFQADRRAITLAEYSVVIGLGMIACVAVTQFLGNPSHVQVYYARAFTPGGLFGH